MSANIKREEVYVHNVVCCQPPRNNISHPDAKIALKICPKAHLLEVIGQMRPNVIVSLGATALKYFFNSTGITKARGKIKVWNGIPIVPTFHPAFLLRGNLQYKSDVIQDFINASEFINQSKSTLSIKIISTTEEVLSLKEEIEKVGRVAIDTETTGLNVYTGDKIIGISFACSRNIGYYIQIRRKSIIGDELEFAVSEDTLSAIKAICENSSAKTFHNALFDIEFLREDLGIEVRNFRADSMALAHVIDENTPNDLEYLTNLYYKDLLGFKTESKQGAAKQSSKSFENLPLSVISNRGGKDAISTFRLTDDLIEEIKKDESLYNYYKSFHLEIFPAILDIQKAGFRVNKEYLLQAKDKYEQALHNISEKIYRVAGYRFNINSPDDLANLFVRLDFPILKRTAIANKISTDKKVLLELQKKVDHPIIELLIAYSKVEKIYSTYIPALIDSMVGDTVHGKLHTTTVATDRLSASDPNQQNVAGNKYIKKSICCRNGNVLLYGDLKQAEVRVFSYLANDSALLEACESSDIYRTMARDMFKTETVTDELRQFSKGMTLGILYMMGDDALSEHLHTSKKHAMEIKDKFFSSFTGVDKFVKETINFLHKNLYVCGVYGGRRRFPRANDDIKTSINRYERQAVNYIIQNATANFVKRSLLRVREALTGFDGKIVVTVHDSIMCEILESQVEQFIPLFVKSMTDPIPPIYAPMKADLKIGTNWWDLKKYKG